MLNYYHINQLAVKCCELCNVELDAMRSKNCYHDANHAKKLLCVVLSRHNVPRSLVSEYLNGLAEYTIWQYSSIFLTKSDLTIVNKLVELSEILLESPNFNILDVKKYDVLLQSRKL